MVWTVSGTFLILVLVYAAWGGGRIALVGPSQNITLTEGESLTSSMWVLNDGDQEATIHLTVSGSVSQVCSVSPDEISLEPGERHSISLAYSVPPGQQPGLLTGELEILVLERGFGILISRDILVRVVSGHQETVVLSLRKGLNLVAWVGPDSLIEDVFGSDQRVLRIWKRSPKGTYVCATNYPDSGWWSADPEFTELKHGEPYFVECSGQVEIQTQRVTHEQVLRLTKGLNLVGWCLPRRMFHEAFPQNSTFHPIERIWHRKAGGGYTFAEYFPDEDVWWSPDADFEAMETGEAYFLECGSDAILTLKS